MLARVTTRLSQYLPLEVARGLRTDRPASMQSAQKSKRFARSAIFFLSVGVGGLERLACAAAVAANPLRTNASSSLFTTLPAWAAGRHDTSDYFLVPPTAAAGVFFCARRLIRPSTPSCFTTA